MASYWLVNTVILASGKRFPGTGLELDAAEKAAYESAGAFLWPQGDATVDAAAARAQDARLQKGANEHETESIMLGAIHKVSSTVSQIFDNTSRPDPATQLTGQQIFNTDDNAPNYSDGADWRDSDGTLT